MPKKKPERRVFSVTMPEELIEALDEYARQYMEANPGGRMSRSGAIEALCREGLERHRRR